MGLLYETSHRVGKYFTVRIPTLGEVLEHEDNYYDVIRILTATPYEMMVQLDDKGYDFTQVSDWKLFCLLFPNLRERDLSLILPDVNFGDFKPAVSRQNGEIVFINEKTNAVFDMEIHAQVRKFLNRVLFIERKNKKPANEDARLYMIDRARKKQQRYRPTEKSELEDLIIALVNSPEFSYDYTSVLGLTIYQFNASVRQVVKRVRFDKLMIGCYAGTVKVDELDEKELSWVSY